MFQTKLFHIYTIMKILAVLPVIIIDFLLLIALFKLGNPIQSYLNQLINSLDSFPAILISLSLVVALIVVPIYVLHTIMTVSLDGLKLFIKRPFFFSTKEMNLTEITGFSQSYSSSKIEIFGVLKIYSPQGNLMLMGRSVDNLTGLKQVLKMNKVHFLGYEPERFDWSVTRFGRRKYMFEQQDFKSETKSIELFEDWLKGPKLKDLLWYWPLLLMWIAIFIYPIILLITL